MNLLSRDSKIKGLDMIIS